MTKPSARNKKFYTQPTLDELMQELYRFTSADLLAQLEDRGIDRTTVEINLMNSTQKST